ncbi:MAG: c-type cytochrome biogenesis protein CcsB [Zetaproteobacteria bacterium]|nr:c-type cytochrome biogenesis protein CcsB [Zetaproteobacteria bacterium]
MNATTINSNNLSWSARLHEGSVAWLRLITYFGMALGAAALAIWGMDAYSENGYLPQLLSLHGATWVIGGGIAGMLFGALTRQKQAQYARVVTGLVPWCDGIIMMVALMAVYTLFEPEAALINYEDQSNFFSGRVVMAMNVLFMFSGICYIAYLFAPERFIARMATMSAWAATYAGGSALLLRWYESYLIMGGDIGHAPVSNLYEVFILLFCIISAMYLAFERRYNAHGMGAFVMVLVAAGVFFSLWLDSIGQADIKPLVPALQSYWMKIHVPLNFVGYGAFAVACAAGMAWLTRARIEKTNPQSRMLNTFPTLDQIDQLAYKAVAVGFPAFTLATILGAAWAAEAWGGYWSWDPKETWALIVWLFYGAYLHVRISHGWNGRTLAWWAVVGFFVTLFCFVGVNMYLSGLHSYGRLV